MRPPRSWPLAAKLSLDLLLAAMIPLAIVAWITAAQSRRELERTAGMLLTRVNSILAGDRHNRFVTLSLLVIDADHGAARWASAGHDPAIIYFPDRGEFEEPEGGDIPLGIVPETTYEEYSRDGLRSGCVIIIGTDGIWEAPSPTKEHFGKERMKEIIRANASRPALEMADVLERAVTAHRAAGAQADDITFVIVKVR